MVGWWACGSAATGSWRYATMPASTIAAVRSDVATGRMMNWRGRVTLPAGGGPFAPSGPRARRRSGEGRGGEGGRFRGGADPLKKKKKRSEGPVLLEQKKLDDEVNRRLNTKTRPHHHN